MPRRVPRLAALALVLAGCSPDSTQDVAVDVERAVRADRPGGPKLSLSSIDPPPSMPGSRASLSSVAPGTFKLPEARASIDEAARRLEISQKQAFERLAAELREAYVGLARAEADEYRKAFSDNTEELYEAAFQKLEAVFAAYANSRGEPLSRLAFLRTLDKDRPKVAAEIKSLQERIDALDTAFTTEARTLFADVEAALARRRDLIDKEVRAIFAEFEAKAARDAERFTAEVEFGIRSRLGEKSLDLPGIPSTSITVDGSTSPPPMPRLQHLEEGGFKEERVRSDLLVWLATKGYRLGGKGSRDATQEFIAWRSSRQGGR